mgnify:CR=1 FL=1
MGKGANKDLFANSGIANKLQGQYSNAANSIYGTINPVLSTQAVQGFTPQQLADVNTAGQQSLGGAVAGAVGQANLQAARTRNAGGYQGAIRSAAQLAMKQNSQNALQTQLASIEQQNKALQALQQLYGTNVGAGLTALGTSNQALNYENQSHPIQQGFQTFGSLVKDLSGAYSNAKGNGGGGGG